MHEKKTHKEKLKTRKASMSLLLRRTRNRLTVAGVAEKYMGGGQME